MYSINTLSPYRNDIAWPVTQVWTIKAPLPMENSICCFTLLHPAGGIRGYYTKEGETREGQWELPESQGGRNSCFIFTTAFALWMCTSKKGPVNHSMWAGMLCLCHSRPWCGAFVLVSSPVGGFQCSEWLHQMIAFPAIINPEFKKNQKKIKSVN